MAPPRVRLGDLLVEAQIVTREQLEEVLALQREDGRRLGVLLVESGLVTETQVTQLLSQQLSVPWVSLYHIDFSRKLLNLVPREIAEQYCLVPIFVRRVRGLGDTLYVAMDDPSDENAQGQVSQFSGLPVRAMIAPPSDIRSAIRVYYGAGTSLSSLSDAEALAAQAEPAEGRADASADSASPASEQERSADAPGARSQSAPPTEGSEVAAKRAQADSVPAEAEAPSDGAGQSSESSPAVFEPSAARPETFSSDSDPRIEAREIDMPLPRRGARQRMISLTLLDGTQISLPARGTAPGAEEAGTPAAGEQLTARDLVAALRAASHGADAAEVLGDNVRWESMFAALLSLLLKKHLIADWEFVEEYRKI